MLKCLHVKYLLFLSDFNKPEFSRQIFEKAQMSTFVKIRSVEAELFHVDGQDITKLIVALRSFVHKQLKREVLQLTTLSYVKEN